ncbi:MAG: hypothetical protein M1825_006440 [Sarcosagium campestre]|nr:MAG: hypothetical protein M1825_006440 [Sarcosagium campestre]
MAGKSKIGEVVEWKGLRRQIELYVPFLGQNMAPRTTSNGRNSSSTLQAGKDKVQRMGEVRPAPSRQPLSDISERAGQAAIPLENQIIDRDDDIFRQYTDVRAASREPPSSHAHQNLFRKASQKLRRKASSKSERSRDSRPSLASLAIPPVEADFDVNVRLPSRSPVRNVPAIQEPVASDSFWKGNYRTFARPVIPYDILDFPQISHASIQLDLRVMASAFMGGGTIQGSLRVRASDVSRHALGPPADIDLIRIVIDVLGYEEAHKNKRCVFLALASDLIDKDHPPPVTMLNPRINNDMRHPKQPWTLFPSCSTLPFQLNLPLNVGPGPFRSKHASIRYILAATILLSNTSRQQMVRDSMTIELLSAFDPDKALVSLPSPLMATDEKAFERAGILEAIRVTAGMHRQNWVSGTRAFVDVKMRNFSQKNIRRIDISLERCIIFYEHQPVSTSHVTATHLRRSKEQSIKVIGQSKYKAAPDSVWKGVEPRSSGTLTCEIVIPEGNLSVRAGRFFEVRYHINVAVGSKFTTYVTIQLPITIIHMNSLDIIPNALTQVAAAIEDRKSRSLRRSRGRTRQRSKSVQARAFSAPRSHALEQLCDPVDVRALTEELENSPRKLHKVHSSLGKRATNSASSSRFRDPGANRHSKEPRLRTSTSGLHFSDSEASVGGEYPVPPGVDY